MPRGVHGSCRLLRHGGPLLPSARKMGLGILFVSHLSFFLFTTWTALPSPRQMEFGKALTLRLPRDIKFKPACGQLGCDLASRRRLLLPTAAALLPTTVVSPRSSPPALLLRVAHSGRIPMAPNDLLHQRPATTAGNSLDPQGRRTRRRKRRDRSRTLGRCSPSMPSRRIESK